MCILEVSSYDRFCKDHAAFIHRQYSGTRALIVLQT